MDAPSQTRTPLHAMSNEQLLFYAEDDLSPHKRDLAVELLEQRADEAWRKWGDDTHRAVPSLTERIAAAAGRKA